MSHITFTLAAVIEHQPYSLAPDQHEPLLEEHEYQVTARTKEEAKTKVFNDAHTNNQKLRRLEITDQKENR
jgi:hypothetical protein